MVTRWTSHVANSSKTRNEKTTVKAAFYILL